MTNKENLDASIAVRITKAEKLGLLKAAEKSHMTVSEYLRALVSVAPLIEKEYKLGEK